jgi:hypothetical protein
MAPPEITHGKLFVDADVIPAPLPQEVLSEAQALDPNLTEAQARGVLRADEKALAHGRDSSRRALPYSPKAWAAIYARILHRVPRAATKAAQEKAKPRIANVIDTARKVRDDPKFKNKRDNMSAVATKVRKLIGSERSWRSIRRNIRDLFEK